MSLWHKLRGCKKPEFETVLADKYVKYGEKIVLSCKGVKKENAIWEKNDHRLQCVDGKHTVKNCGTTFTLEIKHAEEADEGKYTLIVENDAGSDSCSAMVYVELKTPWREVKWRQTDVMVSELQKIKISNNDVKQLNFLLYGPVGAGKSSSINTIKSIFAGRQYVSCLAAAGRSTSHTLCFEKVVISKTNGESLPFAFFDVMGLEREENNENKNGVHIEDIIMSLKGHVKEGYMFNSSVPIPNTNLYYNANPSLSDKMHCLMCVVPADSLSLMDTKFIEKMQTVRKKASELGIPEVVFLTKVDCACPLTKRTLQNVYKSRRIKDKIKECSNALTVPANCIFPVQNYHEESHMNDDINSLMLDALTQIVHWANDYVEKCSNKQTQTKYMKTSAE